MRQMRLFVAINFPDEIKNTLGSFIKDIRALPSNAKWVETENLHLTVCFLGDVPAIKIAFIVEALRRSVEGVSPFYLNLGGVGLFPSKERPRVFWAGVSGETAALLQLNSQVQQGLKRIGFATGEKRFSPHLTLARLRSPEGFPAVFDQAEKIARDREFGVAKITSVDLMLSKLGPQGPKYSVIQRIRLAGD